MGDLRTLKAAVDGLCHIVDRLSTSGPPPRFVQYGNVPVERYDPADHTNGLACYLKAVKTCSTLNGVITLLASCYVQEAYALCRIAGDQIDDINYLLQGRGENGALDARQQAALEEFYQEEFEDPTEPVKTSQRRHRLDRLKISAAINSDEGIPDPSSARSIHRMLYRAFSGYVHGAYVHIMELAGDTLGRYRMHGTPERIDEAVSFVPNYAYRAMLAVEGLVKVSGRADLLPEITALRKRFGTEFDVLPNRAGKP